MIKFEHPVHRLEQPKRKPCRPTDYTTELAAELCELIGDGLSLREVAEREGMPSKATIMTWVGKHAEFREMYTFALMARFDEWAEQMVKIAAGEPGPIPEEDENNTGKDNPRVAGVKQTIQRARLELEWRWRIMGKRLPKVYGEPAETAVPAEATAQAPAPRPLVVVPKGNTFEVVKGKAS